MKDKNPLLTFVVVGGGFAGVETVAGINDFLREVLPSYSHLSEGMLRVVLVHAGVVVLPELGEKLGTYAQKKLAQRGVEIRLNSRVNGVTARTVRLNDGTAIESSTVVWAAGTAPDPILKELPCTKERGRLVVNPFLEVVGWRGVWALGGCAAVPDASTGPPTAQHALREGKALARNLTADIRGQSKRPSSFRLSASLRRLENEPVLRTFSVATSLASLHGGFGDAST